MPSLRVHCAISKKRTGNSFEELHTWMDKPSKDYGVDHREKRHAFTQAMRREIEEYWEKKGRGMGQKAVVEWLFHIALDNLSTSFKEAWKAYGKNRYNLFTFGLECFSNYIHVESERLNDEELREEFGEDSIDGEDDECPFCSYPGAPFHGNNGPCPNCGGYGWGWK